MLATADEDVRLLVPANDEPDPEVSIVVPAANEERTIVEFVAWCHEGLARAGVRGEILIVDSSTDRTAELAVANGARVLRTPRRGLGRAYIDAIPHVRGRYVLMGDADCTYDFRELAAFVEQFRAGYEFVMGTRFKGEIEPHAMPRLHRYVGTPVTTWILNLLYGSHFSDIHCGMRAMTIEALRRVNLRSQSWENASEMILRSVHLGLRTSEVPVRFLRDQPGRVSHHKRMGWWSPYAAAWINLRAMFVYGVDFFTVKPGIALTFLGLLIALPLSSGPLEIGSVTLSLYTMFIGVALATLGIVSIYVGLAARSLYDDSGEVLRRILRVFRYTRTLIVSGVLFVAGIALVLVLLITYLQDGRLVEGATVNHLAVLGLLLMMVGFLTFVFGLFFHAIRTRYEPRLSEQALAGVVAGAERVLRTPVEADVKEDVDS